MAAQPIPLPSPDHVAAFRSLVAWVRSDPALSRVVRSWRVWDGSKGEDQLDVSPAQVPCVRITPTMLPRTPFCLLGNGLRSWESPMEIECEVGFSGTLADDSMRLDKALFDRVMSWPYSAANVSDLIAMDAAQSVNGTGEVAGATAKFRLEMYVSG